MRDRAENPAQLSDKEMMRLNQLLIDCGAKLQNFLDTYNNNPKQYAQNILKTMSSEQKLAAIRLVYNIKNEMVAHELVTHRAFNKDLSRDMGELKAIRRSADRDFVQNKGYIGDRRLSEILRILRDNEYIHLNMPVLSKIPGKKNIKSHIRKYSNESIRDSIAHGKRAGGKPIADTLSPEFERLIRLISNPDVISYAHESRKESGLLLKAIKLQTLGELYAFRLQEDEEKIMDYLKAMFEDNRFFKKEEAINNLNRSGVQSYRKRLLSLTEGQLEELVNKTVLYFKDNPINHNYLFSIIFNPIYD